MKLLMRCAVLTIGAVICLKSFAADTAVEWGYSGASGPEHWGQLSPTFSACDSGKLQSPINIVADQAKPASNQLTFAYHKEPMLVLDEEAVAKSPSQSVEKGELGVQVDILHHHHDILNFAGQSYELQQFHFHTPSENELNGQQYPMEIHFVHKNKKGQLLVLGVFVQEGADNPTLQYIINHFPTANASPEKVKLNPTDLLPNDLAYYQFSGSLTTPPCTEGVQWVVLATPITASAPQIQAFVKEASESNARPIQPLNSRPVFSAPNK